MTERTNKRFLDAVKDNDLISVKNWLQQGADVNYKNDKDPLRKSALHIAAENGNLGIVNAIIKDNPNINITDFYGNTPLHTASIQNHPDVVIALINAGADVNAVNNRNETPLHMATFRNDSLDVIRILTYNNAIQDIQTEDGHTALYLAQNYNDNPKIIEFLQNPKKIQNTSNRLNVFEEIGLHPDANVESLQDLEDYIGPEEGGKRRKTKKRSKTKKRRKTKKTKKSY
jgi:ankyrin repeat protein